MPLRYPATVAQGTSGSKLPQDWKSEDPVLLHLKGMREGNVF